MKFQFLHHLESHDQHQLAKKQQSGFGGLLSFELEGGKEAGWNLIDATRLISITANLGDTKSTITHPATTTHGRLTSEQRAEAGISDGLIRIAVGLEDEKAPWDKMTSDFKNFTNIIDLDKWESKKVIDYGITAIPSYFILDANKKIIAKPHDVEELKEMFEEK